MGEYGGAGPFEIRFRNEIKLAALYESSCNLFHKIVQHGGTTTFAGTYSHVYDSLPSSTRS